MRHAWETKEPKHKSDEELAFEAKDGLRGQGNVVEAMTRLRKSTNHLAWVLIVLTGVIVLLTAVMAYPLILRFFS